MKKVKELTRSIIIQKIADVLKPLDYVHAFWEGSAVAFSRIDAWSDIDIYAVVDNDKVKPTFRAVERALTSLSSIKQKYEVSQFPWPGLSQSFYKLEDASEYLIIDLAVLNLNCQEDFLEPKIHGETVFIFNKSNQVKIPSFDAELLASRLQKRLMKLRARFDMFHIFVQKEINRGNHLEAIDFFYTLLAILVETLRIKYYPYHYNFKMRYIHYELPSEIIMKLKNLYFVVDEKDIQKKYNELVDWFHQVSSETNLDMLKLSDKGDLEK